MLKTVLQVMGYLEDDELSLVKFKKILVFHFTYQK